MLMMDVGKLRKWRKPKLTIITIIHYMYIFDNTENANLMFRVLSFMIKSTAKSNILFLHKIK